MKYRTEIDGLRAIALLAVIFFHAGFQFFSGGFIGVDIFFVISGYLITTSLINEQLTHSFSLVNFYTRRARRLLPALFFVVFTCLPIAWLWMLPSQFKDFSKSVIAVSLFSSNFLFWLESGYFDAIAELKPLLHTWSLAVEEQYYLLFPLFILLIWPLGQRLIIHLLIGIGLLSLAIAHWGSALAPGATFYLLPSRLWEFIIGAFVAFYLLKYPAKQASSMPWFARSQLLSLLGILLLGYAIHYFDTQTPVPSLSTLIPTSGTALILLFATPSTFVGQVLSHRLLTPIGLISYSAYLWHQPLFAFARILRDQQPPPSTMLWLSFGTLILAYFTWKYVEQPFRNPKKMAQDEVFYAATTLSMISILIGAVGYANNGFEPTAIATVLPDHEQQSIQSIQSNGEFSHLCEDILSTGEPCPSNPLTPVQHLSTTAQPPAVPQLNLTERLRVNLGLNPVCEGRLLTSNACSTAPDPQIAVWGDSFAMHLIQGIIASKPDVKLIQITKSVCGPILDIAPTNRDNPPAWADGCITFNNRVLDWLKSHRTSIRYVVLGSPFQQYLSSTWHLKTPKQIIPVNEELVLNQLKYTLNQITALGIQPVIFAPPPSSGMHLGNCLAKAALAKKSLSQCNFKESDYHAYQKDVIHLLQELDQSYHIVWIGDEICTNGECPAGWDDIFLYTDQGHFSHEGSAAVGKKLNFYQRITANPKY